MIWVADIVDSRSRKSVSCGRLRYNDESDQFSIEISEDVAVADLPMMFAAFAKRGEFHLDDKWARRWVQDRIVPPGRQNLGEILRAHGLTAYNEFALLESSRGFSANDDFILSAPKAATLGEGETPMRLQGAPDANARSETAAEVGRVIAQARENAGLSQYQLAERMGCDQAAISRIESGKGNPTLGTIADIASCLGMEASLILGDAC